MELDDSVFRPLLDYLRTTKQPQSQILGLAYKRGFPPDLSKRSWTDPRLHHLVMKVGLVTVGDLPFTSAQLFSGDGKLEKRRDGNTFMVRFGSYTGGEIVIDNIEHNIRHTPKIISQTAETFLKEAVGVCWTLAFYTLKTKIPAVRKLSDYEAVYESGKWSIAFYRAGQPTIYLSKKSGLVTLTAKKEAEQWSFAGAVKPAKPTGPVDDVRFSAAQNLMLRSAVVSGMGNSDEDL